MGRLFQLFRERWGGWLSAFNQPGLTEAVHQAEVEITGKSGQGVSPALDEASRRIYRALYGVDPARVAQRDPAVLAPAEAALADLPRRALAQILRETVEEAKRISLPGPGVREAVEGYRRGEINDEKVANVLSKAVFSDSILSGSLEQAQLIKLLAVFDPERAEKIGRALGPSDTQFATGVEEVKAQITTATDESFWDAFYPRLNEDQRTEIMNHLQRARQRGKDVEITAVTGLTDFYLHTDPGLAAVADRMAGEYRVEGIRFKVFHDLRSRPKTPEAFEAPGLMVPDKMVEPAFLWPEGSRPPVRLTEPLDITDMLEIRPTGWIALSYNPTLTLQHILSQDVLLITLRDDQGTAILAFA